MRFLWLVFCATLVQFKLFAQDDGTTQVPQIRYTIAGDLVVFGDSLDVEERSDSIEFMLENYSMILSRQSKTVLFDLRKLGLLKGKDTLLQPVYGEIKRWGSVIRAWKGGGYILLDTSGNIIQPNLLNPFKQIPEMGVDIIKSDSGFGLIRNDGKWILTPNCLNLVYHEGIGFRYSLKETTELYGFLNLNFQEIIPPKYEYLYLDRGKGFVLFHIRDDRGRSGLLSSDGKPCLELGKQTIGMFSEGLAPVERNGLWGAVDTQCVQLIPCKYTQVLPRKQVILCYKPNLVWDIYTLEGALLAEDIAYSGTTPYGFGMVRRDTLWGIVGVDRGSRLFWEPEFISLKEVMTDTAWNAHYMVFEKNGKYGVLDALNNRIVSPELMDQVVIAKYTKLNGYSIGRMRIYGRRGDKWALIGAPGDKVSFTIRELKQHIEANQPAPYVFHSYDTLPALD